MAGSFKLPGMGFILVLMLGACSHTQTASGGKNFRRVDESFYRGMRPSGNGWQVLRDFGIRTVISAEEDSEAIASGWAAAEALGMEFVSLPLSLYEWPPDAVMLAFLETVLNRQKQPVFLYCGSGKDRTGTFAAVYRVIVQHWGPKEAYEEAKKYGFWPYRGEAVLKKYIHQLKDRGLLYDKVKQLRTSP